MASPDPYRALGVARDASAEDIKKAYKKLARKYHPDLNSDPGAEDRFKEANAAYDILGDSEKRAMYDRFGEASTRPGFNADQANAWQQAGGFSGGFPGGDMSDILESLFGGGTGFRGPRKGADLRLRLAVDPMMSFTGGETSVRLSRPDGTTETLKVKVPAGVTDAGKLRLKGRGHPPPGGGPCGDLILVLDISPHKLLRRSEDDLEMDVPITVAEAVRGASITVPTPTGDVVVKVPPGTTSTRRLRLRGRGVQRRQAGDLYLMLRVTLPDNMEDLDDAIDAVEEAYETPLREQLVL